MSPTKTVDRPASYYCGAKRRQGGAPCRLRAGQGTDHLGTGKCSRHGGSTRMQRRGAHRQEALAFAFGALGAEVSDDPLEALLQSVRLASGQVAYWRVRLLPYQAGGEKADELEPPDLIAGLDSALDRQQKCAKAALDAKVDEKLVQINMRFAERLTLAFEDAVAAMKLDAATKAIGVAAYTQALVRLEGEPVDGSARRLGA